MRLHFISWFATTQAYKPTCADLGRILEQPLPFGARKVGAVDLLTRVPRVALISFLFSLIFLTCATDFAEREGLLVIWPDCTLLYSAIEL